MTILVQLILALWLQLAEPGCTTPDVVIGDGFGTSSMECVR